MTLFFKTRGCNQLDNLIYLHLVKRGFIDRELNQDWYLHIYNWCTWGCREISRPVNWFPNACTCKNTWNYNWKQEIGWKENIMLLNLEYGFGDSRQNGEDEQLVVKANSHGLGFETMVITKNQIG